MSLGTFDFLATKGKPEEFFPLYGRYMNVRAGTDETIAEVLHSLALPFNNPKAPFSSAKKFEQEMIKHILHWTEEVEESVRISKEHLKLKGGNPVSSAFRKLKGAMELGGDLTKLDTVSKCEKFVKETNKQRAAEEEHGMMVREQRQMMIEEGKDPDTPEGKAELKQRVDAMMGKIGGSSSKGDGGAKSIGGFEVSEAEKNFLLVYRDYCKAYGEKGGAQFLSGRIKQMKEAIDAHIKSVAANSKLITGDDSEGDKAA